MTSRKNDKRGQAGAGYDMSHLKTDKDSTIENALEEIERLNHQEGALWRRVIRLERALAPFGSGEASDRIASGDHSVMQDRLSDWTDAKDWENAREVLKDRSFMDRPSEK